MPKLTTETTNRKGLIIKRATAIDALKALFFFSSINSEGREYGSLTLSINSDKSPIPEITELYASCSVLPSCIWSLYFYFRFSNNSSLSSLTFFVSLTPVKLLSI